MNGIDDDFLGEVDRRADRVLDRSKRSKWTAFHILGVFLAGWLVGTFQLDAVIWLLEILWWL